MIRHIIVAFAQLGVVGVCVICTACTVTPSLPSAPVGDANNNRLMHSMRLGSDAQKAAALLALGQDAYVSQPQDAPLLAHVLYALDQLGVHHQPGNSDVFLAWRSAAKKAGEETPALYRGRLLGPAYASGELEQGTHYTLEQLFVAGRKANVAVSSPQRGKNISLTVLKDDGQPICTASLDKSNNCAWVPLFTERYTIKLTNQGETKLNFFLAID